MKNNKLYPVFKHFLISFVFINIYMLIIEKSYSLRNLSDSLTIIGFLYLIIGFFRLVKNLGFFNLFHFGFKKLRELIFIKKEELKQGEYHDFVKTKKTKAYLEFILTGFILVSLSILVAFI